MDNPRSKRIQKTLEKAVQFSKTSNSGGRVSVATIALDKKNIEICRATNNYKKSSPIQARFAAKVGLPEKQFLHAEVKVLLKALRSGATISTLVVARTSKEGEVMDGKPCCICSAYLGYVEQLQGSKIDVIFSKRETS